MGERQDPYAEHRGKWDVSGWWHCDCGVAWPPEKRTCSERDHQGCGIRRPLKDAPVYDLRDSLRQGGFMSHMQLRRVVADPPGGESQ